jgi:hypothetical protein
MSESSNLHFGSRGSIDLLNMCSWIFQGLLRVQGRPAVSYDDQGMVFAVAYGGHIRMFDARKFEKVFD